MRDNLRAVASRAERLLRELIKAIGAGDVAAARAALDAGADPSGTGAYNVTPLGSATSLRDESARDALTELLLARGADPNDRGPYGFDNRPIFYAAHCGHEAVVRMLLASGGFPRDEAGAPARNSDGSTLLALACTSGKRWLAGLDPTAVDHTGKIPLATAATSKPVLKKRRPPLAPSQTALLAALVAATPPALARKIALPT